MERPMLTDNTPLEDHFDQFGLMVKREDLSCAPPGPPFSKTRGVYAHVKARPEGTIGVLDTSHSQAGHAVAQACQLLGKRCINFYPVRKAEQFDALRPQQQAAQALGAELVSLQAGRSAILYHAAKAKLREQGDDIYMMPNALKLPEMVTETALEVERTLHTRPDLGLSRSSPVLIAISSGTIAAGVLRGFMLGGGFFSRKFILHQGYDRPAGATLRYISEQSGIQLAVLEPHVILVNEGYSYADRARPGPDAPFPCNEYYDLKAFRWWLREGRAQWGEALMWNIGK